MHLSGASNPFYYSSITTSAFSSLPMVIYPPILNSLYNHTRGMNHHSPWSFSDKLGHDNSAPGTITPSQFVVILLPMKLNLIAEAV